MGTRGYNDKGYRVGESHHNAKISDHDVDLILELKYQGLTVQQIAMKFEIAESTVRDIVKGRRRAQFPTKWK